MLAVSLEDGNLAYSGREGLLQVLCGFSFRVRAGEIVAILGASGSGKSSLLRVISGQEKLSGGSIRALGGAPTVGMRTGRIAIASQDAVLLPWRTAKSNARLPLDLLGCPRAKGDEAALGLLSRLRIEGFANQRPAHLSEGQCQRLRLAQAISTAPDLLLLDEPFNSCDEGLRSVLTDFVSRFVREDPHRSAVLVTHFSFEAAAMADRIVVVGGPPLLELHAFDISDSPAERSLEQILSLTADLRPHLLRSASEYAAGE